MPCEVGLYFLLRAHKTSGRPVSFPKITPTRDCSLSFQHQDSPLLQEPKPAAPPY
jgi:hypothetical protein